MKIGLKLILFNSQQELLLLQVPPDDKLHGKWSVPGGGLNEGEDPYDGIKRELKEETQLRVINPRPFHVRSYYHGQEFVVAIGFIGQAKTTKVKLNQEHSAANWVTATQALDYDLTQDARVFIEHWVKQYALSSS